MKFLIVQLPPFSRHLIPLRSKYSSQNPVHKHPQSLADYNLDEKRSSGDSDENCDWKNLISVKEDD
jgi:hypothetical protein